MSEIIGEKATYYQYRLLRKIYVSRPVIWSYVSLACIMFFASLLSFTWFGILCYFLAFITMVWAHYVISRSVLRLSKRNLKQWKYTRKLPWIGLMPEQHVSYRFFSKIHLHIAWISLVLIFVFIVTGPIAFSINLLFWHLWLLLPRLYCMGWLLRERKDGLIKITNEDISYYIQ